MYQVITNPETGSQVSIYGKIGKMFYKNMLV